MELLLFVLILSSIFYLIKRYLNFLVSLFLSRYLRCESVRLQGCTLFSIKNAKFVFKNGISIEIENLHLGSSFISQESSKPISLFADDIRIESQSALDFFHRDTDKVGEAKDINDNLSNLDTQTRRIKKILQFIQYANARFNCVNIVLLEAIPDCLLHISFENLQVETYRDREGLQLEVSYKLTQAKLFVRNFQRSICLAQINLAGLFSIEVSEKKCNIKKLSLIFNNPRFSIFDDLFVYLSTHQFYGFSNMSSSSVDKSHNLSAKTLSPLNLHHFLSRWLPSFHVEVDNLTVQFMAQLKVEAHRSMSMNFHNLRLDFSTAKRQFHVELDEFSLNEHASSSTRLKCQKMAARSEYSIPETTTEATIAVSSTMVALSAELDVQRPLLMLHQQDLVWWLGYAQRLESTIRATSSIMLDDRRKSKLLKKDLGAFDEAKEAEEPSKRVPAIFSVILKLNVNDFETQLINPNGAEIAFGIELMTLTADNKLEHFEFGVESLWCHRANSIARSDFKSMEFSRHTWGTLLAIGGGLAELTKKDASNDYQLCIQLDECQFEWEESMVVQLVEFAQLLLPQKQEKESTLQDAAQLPSLILKVSARKLDLFFTARQSIFLAFSIECWRIEANFGAANYVTTLESVQVGQAEMTKGEVRCDWWRPVPVTGKRPSMYCGGVENLCVRFSTTKGAAGGRPTVRDMSLHAGSSAEFCWSTSLHLIVLETIRAAKRLISSVKQSFSEESNVAVSRQSYDAKATKLPMIISVISEHPVELSFKLPREHIMRWIVPSIHFRKTNDVDGFASSAIGTPSFLIEMDGHIILNAEQPVIRVTPSGVDAAMNGARRDYKQFAWAVNRLWWWSADTFELVFPYGYNFADTFDEIINSIKWIKLVHDIRPKPFTADSPLPADVRISIKRISMKMNDDAFEVRLQNIYEVMMDEIFERERRRQMLEAKIQQLSKEDPLFPKAKMDALYSLLVKKDAQIYIERVGKIQQQSQSGERFLMAWTWSDVELRVFSDPIFNGTDNCVAHIRRFNPESVLSPDAVFTTLWARAVELDVAESSIHFRDYPLPYMNVRDAHYFGTLVGAEQLMSERSIRTQYVDAPPPWGRYTIGRNMCPLKFYYDMACEIEELNSTYGPCWEPCLSMISLCWNLVNAPSRDPSEPLPFWDKIRLLLHGRFSMLCKRLVTSMLASTDPYNDTELIEMAWENFEFDWTAGELRIQTDLDAFIRTASKYDDSRLLHLPKFKCAIHVDWDCIGDPHDHHSCAPCAPNKLPDYSTNVPHDSYRAFRSNHAVMVMRFEVKHDAESSSTKSSDCPQILLYANTFKCLDFMMNTLTMVNRPVKRGPLFGNPIMRKCQLSRHFKTVTVNATLPRFLISYWMSFSSPYGFRMISDSLRLTMTASLRLSFSTFTSSTTNALTNVSAAERRGSGDGLARRARSSWKISHMSAQLENAQIHLFGEKRQPAAAHDDHQASTRQRGGGGGMFGGVSSDRSMPPDSFFVGLSRLNYIREWSFPHAHQQQQQQQMAAMMKGLNCGGVGVPPLKSDTPVQHRLTVHDLKASWTTENRDICLVIAEGVQRAHVLRKILDNEALKMFQFTYEDNSNPIGRGGMHKKTTQQKKTSRPNTDPLSASDRAKYRRHSPTAATGAPSDDTDDMLWKLVDEAETNLVAYSEETVEHPTDSLYGVVLCGRNDVRLINWQIDLLNSQLVLKGCTKAGFILVTAAKASVTQRFHHPVWRHTQLLLKRSWSAVLSGMQYFAPLVIGKGISNADGFRWLQREVIEEKPLADPSAANDKVNNYSATGEAVGGVVSDQTSKDSLRNVQFLAAPSATTSQSVVSDVSGIVSESEFPMDDTPSSANTNLADAHLQLQRVASRCSCQLFFCYYSDTINMEKLEQADVHIPNMDEVNDDHNTSASLPGAWESRRCEEVDCFTLKHNMLEVSTNSEQYQMCIDIVNNLLLFVDPKKTQFEENRRRLWFKLAKRSKQYVREQIVKMQSVLREVVSIVRALERQSYFLNKELLNQPADPVLNAENAQLQADIDEHKSRLNVMIDELAMMISCFKEKEVEEQAHANRLQLLRETAAAAERDADAGGGYGGYYAGNDDYDGGLQPLLIARRFEVCFEDCIWRLTESDGQLSLAEVQIRNFLYTRTARIDNSGDHLLEIGMVKVLNLLPNSKYKEALARLPNPDNMVNLAAESGTSANNQTTATSAADKTPSIRVICRELPPVGGISIKEHFEVNIVPMNAQITYRFFEKMMAFFFPGRNIDKEDQQNLDTTDDQQPHQQGFSLARRFRGAVNHSFRSGGGAASTNAFGDSGSAPAVAQSGGVVVGGNAMLGSRSAGGGAPILSRMDFSMAIRDEIDKMKERAKKNNMFIYIIIPPVPFVVSYKGNKEKNIEDVDRFNLTFPICEYHDKNWTWLDFSLAIKQRCKRIILQQFMAQKLLRNRIMGGIDRMPLPGGAETIIDEEEKKRIVLGTAAATGKDKKKRKT